MSRSSNQNPSVCSFGRSRQCISRGEAPVIRSANKAPPKAPPREAHTAAMPIKPLKRRCVLAPTSHSICFKTLKMILPNRKTIANGPKAKPMTTSSQWVVLASYYYCRLIFGPKAPLTSGLVALGLRNASFTAISGSKARHRIVSCASPLCSNVKLSGSELEASTSLNDFRSPDLLRDMLSGNRMSVGLTLMLPEFQMSRTVC